MSEADAQFTRIKHTRRRIASGGLEFIFVTDCSAHQKWMAYTLLHSARSVGQMDPITWLRANCGSKEGHDKEEELVRKTNPMARLVHMEANLTLINRNTNRAESFHLTMKPRAVLEFLRANQDFVEFSALAKSKLLWLFSYRNVGVLNGEALFQG